MTHWPFGDLDYSLHFVGVFNIHKGAYMTNMVIALWLIYGVIVIYLSHSK